MSENFEDVNCPDIFTNENNAFSSCEHTFPTEVVTILDNSYSPEITFDGVNLLLDFDGLPSGNYEWYFDPIEAYSPESQVADFQLLSEFNNTSLIPSQGSGNYYVVISSIPAGDCRYISNVFELTDCDFPYATSPITDPTIDAANGSPYGYIQPLETVTLDPFTFSTMEITVDGIIQVYGTLIIEDLDLFMLNGSHILVYPGGSVRVLNSNMSSYCGDTWEGIKVMGPNVDHPNYENDEMIPLESNAHGFLELNNSSIQDAHIGVWLTAEGFYSEGNGILHAHNNSRFINNQTAVIFGGFGNQNRSVITNCEFDNSEITHITLRRNGTIEEGGMAQINRNEFNNSKNDPNTVGIISWDSNAIIGSDINTNWGNSFNSLYWGADIYGDGSALSAVHFYNNDFNSVRKGITLNTTALNIILGNNFNRMPYGYSNGTNEEYDVYGIFLNHSFGFDIRNNVFETSLLSNNQIRGIVLSDTYFNGEPSVDARINDNIFKATVNGNLGFTDGIQFYGNNRNVQLRCNEFFTKNHGDWTFLGGAQISPQGIDPTLDPNDNDVQNSFSNSWNNYGSEEAFHVFIDNDNGGLAGPILLYPDVNSIPLKINTIGDVSFTSYDEIGINETFDCSILDIDDGPPFYNPVPPGGGNECVIKGDELRYLASVRDYATIRERFECVGFDEKIWKDQVLVANYIVERDYEAASAKLETIPSNTTALEQFHIIFSTKIAELQEGSGKAPINIDKIERIAGVPNPRARKSEAAALAESYLAMIHQKTYKRSAITEMTVKRNEKAINDYKPLTLMPNPSSSDFRILENVSGQLKIYDALSNLILEQHYSATNQVNVQNLQNGLYFVVLIDNDGVAYLSKLIVQ